jgi:hypothetical protein
LPVDELKSMSRVVLTGGGRRQRRHSTSPLEIGNRLRAASRDLRGFEPN